MAQMCDDLETQLNDGSWMETGGGLNGETAGQSIMRFAGLSAALCFSTMMINRKVANRMDAWQIDGETAGAGGPLRPHPVGAFDFMDESDTESIRKMPMSHFIDNVNSSCATSVSGSVHNFVGHHRRNSSIQSNPRHGPRMCIQKTVGTNPVHEEPKEEKKKVKMVDRGCSPFPLECFDSDIDSEERFGLACDLWHFRPTVTPGTEAELFAEQQLYVKSEQKAWLKQLETVRRDPWKKNPFKPDNDVKAPDEDVPQYTTWNLFKRIIWGDPQASSNISTPKKWQLG